MIGITFALPAESSAFVRLLDHTSRTAGNDESIRGWIHGQAVTILHTGVGQKCCLSRIENFLGGGKFRYLISAGFAGALDRELQVGHLFLAENFSSAELLHSPRLDLRTDNVFVGQLTTVPRMIDAQSEREQLARDTGAAAVDMETEFIAAACARRMVPMLSLRAISDTPMEPFPAPPQVLFDIEKQKTDFARFAFYLAMHPGAVGKLNAFRQRIAVARESLRQALQNLLRADLI